MNDNLLKLRSVLKTMPLNDNQIDNILGIIDTQNKEIDDVVLPLLEDYYSYGIEKDFRINTSDCIRVGNLDLHRTLPIQSKMRGCLLDDDGNVVEYLPENDWTTATRDGSKGQVMVHIPAHYRKFYTKDEDNIIGVRISLHNIKGYHYVPDMFIGAYEAALDRINLKLSSVVNTTVDFRGGVNTTSWDNTYRSLLGRPATNINKINFQKYARNRGNISWNICTYELRKTLTWLYVIEYANFNCQLDYNSQLTAHGYHQGGLGNGVTGIINILDYNNCNSFIPCGHTDILGNNSGVVDYNAYNEDETLFTKQSVPRYRGIENLYGHIWEFIEGINVMISTSIDNGGTGLSKVYVCNDLNNFDSFSINNYTYIGNEARNAKGYIKRLIFGDNGSIIPLSIGGTSEYPVGDHFYTVIPTKYASTELRSVVIGSSAKENAEMTGLFYECSDRVPSSKDIYIGTRLCFIPQQNKN